MSDDSYDVLIIGAGPAGSTAAIILSQLERRVALIDRPAAAPDAPNLVWISVKTEGLLAELKIPAKSVLSEPFADVELVSGDFGKRAAPKFGSVAGYLVDRTRFASTLREAAIKRGVSFCENSGVIDIRLNESSVELGMADNEVLKGKLLIVASGSGSELLERVGFAQHPGDSPIWTAQVESPLTGAARPASAHVAVVLGLDGGGSFGLCCISKGAVAISINWRGEPENIIARLTTLCRAAFESGVVPVDLSEHVATVRPSRSPAAAALDLDTHVAKHTLVIGDAGGFVSAASNEGIYPAMWSAKLASKAVDTALKTTLSQDELMTFDSIWRMEMADHLRSPHTDIRFLLPLVFSNQPMADRMGAAFFFGENI